MGKVPPKKKGRKAAKRQDTSILLDKENHTLPLVRSRSMSVGETNQKSVLVLNIDKPKTK